MEKPAQIVVLQPAIPEPSASARTSGGNVIVNPEGKVLSEATCGDEGKGVGNEQIGSRHIAGCLNRLGLIGVPSKVSFIAKRDRNRSRNLARVHSFGKRLLLGFRP